MTIVQLFFTVYLQEVFMKYLLFDLDGTLANSSKGIKAAFRYTFSSLQLCLPSDKELSTFIGPPLEVTFAQFFQEKKDIDLAIKHFRTYYNNKGVHQTSLYPGIPTLLKELKSLDYDLFVTTSKYEPMANLMLTELGIIDYFIAVYGSTPAHYHKADVIATCIKKESLSKLETIIIGDTKFDIIGGKKTGIKTLGVTWGFGVQKDFKTSGADIICQQPLDIKKALESL